MTNAVPPRLISRHTTWIISFAKQMAGIFINEISIISIWKRLKACVCQARQEHRAGRISFRAVSNLLFICNIHQHQCPSCNNIQTCGRSFGPDNRLLIVVVSLADSVRMCSPFLQNKWWWISVEVNRCKSHPQHSSNSVSFESPHNHTTKRASSTFSFVESSQQALLRLWQHSCDVRSTRVPTMWLRLMVRTTFLDTHTCAISYHSF